MSHGALDFISIRERVWVPDALLASLPAIERMRLERETVVKLKPNRYKPKQAPIDCRVRNPETCRVGLPLNVGLKLISKYKWHTRAGLVREGRIAPKHGHKFTRFPDPHHPKAPPNQEQFMRDLERGLVLHENLMGEAPTGLGKTVCALNAFAKLGVRFVVVVPKIFIARQWMKEAQEHLGLHPSQIGLVADGICDYENKVMVVVVIHNVISDKLPSDFFKLFGGACFDECHRLGAEQFSKAAGRFPAQYRLALTANPHCRRKDKAEQVVFAFFGTPVVVAQAEALEADCFVIDHVSAKKPHPKMPDARKLNMLCVDDTRNNIISEITYRKWQQGRQVVVFSDRIQHLAALRWELLNTYFIPEEEVGLFTSQVEQPDGTRKKVPQSALDKVKAKCSVIFATYSMMQEAVDIPRLDTGIEATPKADSLQAIGRIRRKFEGKKRPLWVAIRDKNFPQFTRMTNSNLKLLAQSNVNIKEYGPATHLIRQAAH